MLLTTIRGEENEKNIIHLGLENIIIGTVTLCVQYTTKYSANISWLNIARNDLLDIYFSYVDKQLLDVSVS